MKLAPRTRPRKAAPPSLPMGRDRPHVLELLARHAADAGISTSEAMRQLLVQFSQEPGAAAREPASIAGSWERPLEGRWSRLVCPHHPHLPDTVRRQARQAGITTPEYIRRAVRRFLREQGHVV